MKASVYSAFLAFNIKQKILKLYLEVTGFKI